jgi:hypothetical protein
MSIYDPPSDPYGCAHPCRYCDQEMEQEWPGVRGSEYICVNPECEHSPMYEEPTPATGREEG